MLRVGSVPYLVGRPLDLGLEEEQGLELTYAVPAKLVQGLRDGSIDVALVSSIELFRRPGYSYLEGLGVSGRGYVSSVQVFLRRPIDDVRVIALDPASRTAAALTRVVWPASGRRPEFREAAPGTDPRGAVADGWLRIGDTALRELAEEPSRPAFNPSQAWAERTGLPFVFAPWIVRRGVDVESHLEAFLRAVQRGLAAREALAREAAERTGIPIEMLTRYLMEECLYTPGQELRPSILAYRDAAAGMELARGELEPRGIPMALPDRLLGERLEAPDGKAF